MEVNNVALGDSFRNYIIHRPEKTPRKSHKIATKTAKINLFTNLFRKTRDNINREALY